MRPPTLTLTLLALLALPTPLRAQDAGDPAATVLSELQQRFEEGEGSRSERYERLRPHFEAFAKEHAGTASGLSARLWLFRKTWYQRKAGTMHQNAVRLFDEILSEHPRSPQLARLIDSQFVLPHARRYELFKRLHDISPHDQVKAHALYAMALASRRHGDASELARGRRHLEELRERYGGTPYKHTTFAAMARAHLDPHDAEDLAIGRPAPEIEGVDLDGRPMKLSDHRGKVVVLDFWGHW